MALGSTLDAAQRPAADALCVAASAAGLTADGTRPHRSAPRGVYLHGPVGRGKTWLVEVLTTQLPSGAVLRLHAYEAARRLHRGIAAHSGTRGGLDAAINAVVGEARALYLDELHAHDPGDAMLLSRLVRALPARGVVLLATSNYAPADLLPDPRYHHLVLPLVEALTATCVVVDVDGGVDHRALGHGGARPRWCTGAWLATGTSAQLAALGLAAPDPAQRRQLLLGGRPLWALAADPHPEEDDDDGDGSVRPEPTAHLHFSELCERPTSVADLLELTDRYRTIVLVGVPPVTASVADAWRRLANLVDICWDRDVRLVVLAADGAECALEMPITDGARMYSRLSLLHRT